MLIPIYKGKGKSKSDPASYRPVSLIPCFSKIFEKLLLNRINAYISCSKIQFPCPQQHGFQKQLSCITTAFNVQEAVFYNVERQSDVYVASLDQKGAFDTVRHTSLFLKLGRMGLVGKLLRIVQASYTDLQCVVRYAKQTSESFKIVRGVRQGGVMSTFLYLVYINELITDLQDCNLGTKIMSTPVSNPSFADDIALLAISPSNLQNMIDMVYRYCQSWRIEVNVKKSSVIVFSKKRYEPRVGILYGQHFLPQDKSMTHLGIIHDSNLKLGNRLKERIQKSRNALFSMVGQGVNPQGVNPIVSANLYCKIILPILLYGSELWNNMTTTDLKQIVIFQHFVAKKLQGFARRTRSDIAESMLGLFRISSLIETRKLMFLHKILCLPEACITKEIFIRKYFMYLSDKNSVTLGFIPDICRTVIKYNLQPILNNFFCDNSLPSKYSWKNTVRNAVRVREQLMWDDRLSNNPDCAFFRLLHPYIHPCIIYRVSKSSSFRSTMNTIAKIWSRPVLTCNTVCTECGKTFQEELGHILSECTLIEEAKSHLKLELSSKYGTTFADDLFEQDSLIFTLRILGAPIFPYLDELDNLQLLDCTFRYIYRCLQMYYSG